MRTLRQLSAGLLVAVVLSGAGALAGAAPAGARTAEELHSNPTSRLAPPNGHRAEAPAPTVTRTIDKGFDLGSAAIGAGVAAAVLLLTAAGASAVSRRHPVEIS